jgi:hypothetical protein
MNKPLKRTVFTLGIVLSIILIIFIVRFIYISVSNYKNAKINSIEELSSLLRVDIAGDSVFIKDITFKNTSYNTYVYVLYEVPESLIEKKYYQSSNYADRHNIFDSTEEYISSFNIKKLTYVNSTYSTYLTYQLLAGQIEQDFEVCIYLIESDILDNGNITILACSVVPYRLEMNIDY